MTRVRIRALRLTNFRNYHAASVETPGVAAGMAAAG